MKIRLFIAIQLPQDIITLLNGMGSSIPGSRPVQPEQLHLSLRFIGEVDHSLFYDIQEQLQLVRFSPITLKLQGVGYFPPRKTPRVTWVGVAPIDGLTRLKNSIDTQLRCCGIPSEKRKFSPHVTLARLKNPPLTRVFQFIAGNNLFSSPEFSVDCFHLYSSHLTKSGAIHTIEASYPTN